MKKLSVKPSERMHRLAAFTLIELLVVVAIIALLIAILLPSLGKARENARIAVCGTHMRQISVAVLMYSDQNNGDMITAQIDPAAGVPTAQFWATDLAVQGYLPSKNNVSSMGTIAQPSLSTIFACPDGLLTENLIGAGGAITFTGGYPRSDYNRYYVRQTIPTPAAGDVTVFTWYVLNAHNISAQSRIGSPGGTGSGAGGPCPFVQFNKPPNTQDPNATLQAPGAFRRKMNMVTAPTRLVLALEASAVSWDANGNIAPTAPDVFPTANPGKPQRLSGRHGDGLNNGTDGYTNFSFFDGHVGKYSTVPYSQCPTTYSLASLNGGLQLVPTVQETLFYLTQQ